MRDGGFDPRLKLPGYLSGSQSTSYDVEYRIRIKYKNKVAVQVYESIRLGEGNTMVSKSALYLK